MKHCFKIIFNSNWSKRRFLEGMHSDYVNSEKLVVINQSAQRNKVNLNNKKNIITFVGKLNKSKGYDLFGQSIIKILNKYKDWSGIVIGDEPRDKLEFNHKNLIKLGFLKHKDVLNIYKKSSIAVVCSRWEEPFGRTSLEASSRGCAVIISNRGGLPETITNGIIIRNLNINNLYKSTYGYLNDTESSVTPQNWVIQMGRCMVRFKDIEFIKVNPEGNGTISIHYGSAIGPGQYADEIMVGSNGQSALGTGLAVGDWNCDGFDDIAKRSIQDKPSPSI